MSVPVLDMTYNMFGGTLNRVQLQLGGGVDAPPDAREAEMRDSDCDCRSRPVELSSTKSRRIYSISCLRQFSVNSERLRSSTEIRRSVNAEDITACTVL